MRYQIVLERNKTTGILYARTHYEEIVLLPNSELVEIKEFEKQHEAHLYLRDLRRSYTPKNKLIDPSYVHPKARNHPTYKDHLKNKGCIK